jgi:hypothetical protein
MVPSKLCDGRRVWYFGSCDAHSASHVPGGLQVSSDISVSSSLRIDLILLSIQFRTGSPESSRRRLWTPIYIHALSPWHLHLPDTHSTGTKLRDARGVPLHRGVHRFTYIQCKLRPF